jgi:aryl-alcohol dehydrogenase-like predicted oxidoreductase
LSDLLKAGKIRAFGASNFKPGRFAEGIAAAKKAGVHFDAQQPEYNLMNREIEAELVPLCAREDVSILPYYGLANGYLTGKYRSEADKAKSLRGGRMDKYMQGKGPAVLAVLDDVAARTKATQAQIALAWVMTKLPTGAPIASATSVAQLNELMGALNVTLSDGDMEALDRASA